MTLIHLCHMLNGRVANMYTWGIIQPEIIGQEDVSIQ
jgi:hypothetical protein